MCNTATTRTSQHIPIGVLSLEFPILYASAVVEPASAVAAAEDVNDAERLSQDPTFRLIGSERIWDRGAALTSRLQSFETELLTQEENLTGLAAINRELIARVEAMDCAE